MKKLIIIIIFLLSVILSFSQVRPPIVTNSLFTTNLTWNNLLMMRDSLSYWLPISDHSFKLIRPDGSLSKTYVFNSDSLTQHDSIYVEWMSQKVGNNGTITTPPGTVNCTYAVTDAGDTIQICDGGTFERNDSTFEVRRNPFCILCWDYRYSTWPKWELLFCENVATGRILIGDNAQKILEMSYDLNIENWRDKIYFKLDTPSVVNQVVMLKGDSVDWQPVPVDSIFVTNINKWVYGSDTMTINMDSLFFYDQKWHNRKDTLIVNSDSLYFVNFSKYFSNKDTIPLIDTTKWQYDDNGIHVGGAKSVGINCDADGFERLKIVAKSNDLNALHVDGGDNYSAGYFESTGNFGIQSSYGGTGSSIYSLAQYGTAGYFNGATGVWTNNAVIRDSLRVGSGSTITRTGTMCGFDFWSGTQAEWTANTPKNGVYPQASTTFWTIKN